MQVLMSIGTDYTVSKPGQEAWENNGNCYNHNFVLDLECRVDIIH